MTATMGPVYCQLLPAFYRWLLDERFAEQQTLHPNDLLTIRTYIPDRRFSFVLPSESHLFFTFAMTHSSFIQTSGSFFTTSILRVSFKTARNYRTSLSHFFCLCSRLFNFSLFRLKTQLNNLSSAPLESDQGQKLDPAQQKS